MPTPVASDYDVAVRDLRRGDAMVRTLAYAFLATMAFGALAVSFVVTPEDIETGRIVLSPTCTSKWLFGVECPTCGLTRAFCAISHGRWSLALGYNRASPLFYLGVWVGGFFALKASLRAFIERQRL